MRLRMFICVAALVLVASVASANLILNGSFEDGLYTGTNGFMTVSAGATSISNWVVVSESVDWIDTYWTASAGVRSIDLSGDRPGMIQQTFGTTAGQKYRVQFDLAGNPDTDSAKVAVSYAPGHEETWTFDTTGHSHGNMGWETKWFSFTANDTGSATLSFASGAENGAYGPALDNISVSAVPEPGTVIAALGLLAPAGLMFRRKRA